MPITYDLSKDVRFKQGKQEGSLIKDQYFVINLLQKGIVSLETIAEFADVELSFVVKTKAAYLMALPLLPKKHKSAQSVADETGLMLEVVEKLKKNMG